MEKRLREISRFFVAPRREFAPAVRARPRTPFSINTSISVYFCSLSLLLNVPGGAAICSEGFVNCFLRVS